MKKCLLAILFVIFFIPVFSQSVNTGSLSITDATFNRPDEGVPPTTLSITGTNVSYDIIILNIATAGLVTVNSVSEWDNFMVLYSSSGFNPLLPLENALVASDDLVGPNAGFTYSFTSPGTYTLVVCSFKNAVSGSYVVTTSAPVPLPLKLLSFTAGKAGGNTNFVKWSSAEESNLISYFVQRGIDGNNFNDLKNGDINAKNSITSSIYSFIDNNPAAGYNYYRLKITDRSGHISYSPIALVKNTSPGITNLRVFPNPSSDYLQIEVKSMINKKAVVTVINASGEIMQSGQYIFNTQAVLSVNIKRLPAGKYFLKTIIDREEAAIPFIKN